MAGRGVQPAPLLQSQARLDETFAGLADADSLSGSLMRGGWIRGGPHHHVHGPLDKKKALKMRGLRFAPLYTESTSEKGKTKWVFGVMSVGLQVCTGIITGLAAFLVGTGITKLGKLRLEAVLGLIREGRWPLACLVHFGIMASYAAVASLPVIFWARTAGSSGIPAVIGLLNGVDLRETDFTWQALVARLIGVTFSVGSGLAVGPEGPMIFVGACVGSILSKIPAQKAVWRYFGRPPSTLNDHVYLRDYVSTGAACGIAAAFKAPIAGTLFVIEEAASHFRREHLAKIFIGAIFAVLVAITAFRYKGLFEYRVTTGAFCEAWQFIGPASLLFYAVVGVVCGLAGALFNWLNLRITRFRARNANATMPARRVVDVLGLCLVSSVMWVIMAALSGDKLAGDPDLFRHGTECIKEGFRDQIITGAVIDLVDGDSGLERRLRYNPKSCFYGVQYDQKKCSDAYQLGRSEEIGSQYARSCTSDLMKGASLPDSESRCCDFKSIPELRAGIFHLPTNASCQDIEFGETFPSLGRHKDSGNRSLDGLSSSGEAAKGFYNPMASLTLVPFADAALNLFSRGTPFLFPAWVMMVFLIVFFLLAAATAGSALPSGLLLPMIIIGALIGRLLTLLSIYVQLYFRFYTAQASSASIWSDNWQPFFSYNNTGGPLSDTAPLSTTGWLDPGFVAIVGAAAMLGGSSRISLMLTVMMVEITGDPSMIGPVGLATLISVVVGNAFNHGLYHSLIDVASLPFLPDRWPKSMPKSLRIYRLLEPPPPPPVCLPLMIAVQDVKLLLEQNAYTGFPVTDVETGAVVGLALRHQVEEEVQRADSEGDGEVDIGKVTDFHCITIRPSLPIEVAYNFFKRMELHHVIVVDDRTQPVAVLTRGRFLPWRVEDDIIGERNLTLSRIRDTITRPIDYREPEAPPTFVRPNVPNRNAVQMSQDALASSGRTE